MIVTYDEEKNNSYIHLIKLSKKASLLSHTFQEDEEKSNLIGNVMKGFQGTRIAKLKARVDDNVQITLQPEKNQMKVQNRHEFGGVIATEKAKYEHQGDCKEEKKEEDLAAMLESHEKSIDYTHKAIMEEVSNFEKSQLDKNQSINRNDKHNSNTSSDKNKFSFLSDPFKKPVMDQIVPLDPNVKNYTLYELRVKTFENTKFVDFFYAPG